MIVKVVNKSCNCLYALFSLSTEIFSRVNKYLECQVVNSFFFSFLFFSSGGRGKLSCFERYANFGSTVGVDLHGAAIRLVKSGVRSSFPPDGQGGKERTLSASGV